MKSRTNAYVYSLFANYIHDAGAIAIAEALKHKNNYVSNLE